MRKLFLDDSRHAPDITWDIVRSYDEFVEYIEIHGVPHTISFDHDLGLEHYNWVVNNEGGTDGKIPYETFNEKSGYECAKWLIARGTLPQYYMVHSMNPVGKANIEFILNAAYKAQKREDNGKRETVGSRNSVSPETAPEHAG